MPSSRVMTMMSQGVPITLLCDLASVADPDSDAINCVERPEKDPIWLDAAEPQTIRRTAASA